MPPEGLEGAACLSTRGSVAAGNCGRAGSRSRLLALVAEAPLATPTVLTAEGALLPPTEVEAGTPTAGGLAARAVAAMLALPLDPPASDPLAMVVAAKLVARLGDPPASSPLLGTESKREKPAPCSIAAPLAAVPLAAGPRWALRAPPLAPLTTTRNSRIH